MSAPQQCYEERAARCDAGERELAARSRRLSFVRLGFFLAILAALGGVLLRAGVGAGPWWLAVAALAALFAGLATWHRRIEQARQRLAGLRALNREALARLGRDWDRCPLPAVPPGMPLASRVERAAVTTPAEPAAHSPSPVTELRTDTAAARDLDLFGRASLFHLLGTVRSPAGRARLADWLLAPASPEEITARQQAVDELAGELELRQQLELACLPLADASGEISAFLRWAEGEPWLSRRPLWLWWARLMALLTLPALTAGLLNWIPLSLAALLPLANMVVAYWTGRHTEEIFGRVDASQAGFQDYAAALEALAGHTFTGGRLTTAADGLAHGSAPAHRALRRLARLVVLADARHGSYVHFIVQTLFLWDLHLLSRFERWQTAHGRRARGWVAAVGEIEALAALAGLAHDNPGWCVPRVASSEPPRLTARQLGHPLLAEPARVCNDVELGPPGTFLLVTGSNMSGKSTLLRAVGVNVVLAQAGGRCCADSLHMPPLALGTSVLIEDSLADGYSFFMAELRRLKEIVELAAACRVGGERTLLFLLDEILRGTNASERRIAVRRVLLHLMKQGAIGAVSTHDLELAEDAELAAAGRLVHFRETVHTAGEGPAMTFDYLLREGVATTVNALKLLDLVGLPRE